MISIKNTLKLLKLIDMPGMSLPGLLIFIALQHK